MKKLTTTLLLSGAVLSLSACGERACNPGLDECSLLGPPYTEERTAKAGAKAPKAPAPVIQAMPEPQPMPEPTPPPAPVVEPMAEPVVDDTPVMQDAEPMVKHISK